MKKLTLIFMFLWFHGLVIGQISLLETYHIGTKVTYYPNACDTLVPEAVAIVPVTWELWRKVLD